MDQTTDLSNLTITLQVDEMEYLDNDSTVDTYFRYPNAITFQDYFYSSPEYKVVWIMKTYIPPIFIILGSIGNVLAILALRGYPCVTSMKFYLTTFAVVNTFVLYLGCGLEWLSHITDLPSIGSLQDWLCKLSQFVFNLITYSPYWMVVLMLVDRIVSVWCPFQARSFCTIFVAKVLTIFMYIGLLVISIHAMWTYELDPFQGMCSIDPLQHYFQRVVWPWIAASIYSYVPLFLMILLLLVLLLGLKMAKGSQPRNEDDQDQVICLSITVAIMFVLLCLPTVVLNFMEYSQPTWLQSYQSYARFYLVSVLCQMLGCVNQAITHIIYFACVPKLLKRLFLICAGDAQPAENNNGIEVNGHLLSTTGENTNTGVITPV